MERSIHNLDINLRPEECFTLKLSSGKHEIFIKSLTQTVVSMSDIQLNDAKFRDINVPRYSFVLG